MNFKKIKKNRACPAELRKKRSGGFTIMEMMVAIAIFLIVVTIGVGALLNTNTIHNKAQGMRVMLDSLNYVMEDMSRNIRTGSEYTINNDSQYNFSFTTAQGESWNYYISDDGALYKKVGNGSAERLTQDGIKIELNNNSGFFKPSNDTGNSQPYLIIRLSGNITYKGSSTPFALETAVSQRLVNK